MTDLLKDPQSGLMLPRTFVDEKQALKAEIDALVDRCVLDNQHLKENYFLLMHAKFNKSGTTFTISQPVISYRLPPFIANSFVWWVSNSRGICEPLWMVPAKKNGKLKVEFNTSGIAYLQAKQAMPA